MEQAHWAEDKGLVVDLDLEEEEESLEDKLENLTEPDRSDRDREPVGVWEIALSLIKKINPNW